MSVEEVRARRLIRSLRAMREGSYSSKVNGESVSVPFADSATLHEVADLLVALKELHSSGSPSLEIAQVRGMAGDLEAGKSLTSVQQAVLGRLLQKRATQIRLLRRDPGREDFLAVPTAGTGR
jgi:hypothetical protein